MQVWDKTIFSLMFKKSEIRKHFLPPLKVDLDKKSRDYCLPGSHNRTKAALLCRHYGLANKVTLAH